MDRNVYDFIITEENSWKTTRIPLTNSKDWSMYEHIERCFNVSNGWFHSGKNDGNRPKTDIVSPIIDVAFRLESFDVKDIIPYVDDIHQSYKSFFVKKYHLQWARKNQLDTFIDEVIESSIIYDLVLVKDVNNVRPEVIALQDIAFCDQTDIMSGPICIKHNWTIPDLLEMKGKWDGNKIDEVIVMAEASKKAALANAGTIKTPGKYVEGYELHGSFPESWLKEDGDPFKYVEQIHIVNYYTSEDGSKNGITLYKGKTKKMSDKFKALKIDTVRSKGRACGRSIVERLFEPQVWHDYSGIKLKKMMDSAVNLLQTDSEEYGNKKLSQLPENTIIKHEPGKPISRIDMGIQNVSIFENQQIKNEQQARTLGSASETALGRNPVSGTPFALQDLVVQEGEGIHTYRQGKIATFFSDVLYQDWILQYLVREMNGGIKFSEELSLEEMQEVANMVAINESNKRIKDLVLSGQVVTQEQQALMMDVFKEGFKKGGNRKFMELIKDELKDIPIKVKVNVAGKQRYMAKNADKISKMISTFLSGGIPLTAMGKQINQLLEESGMSPIDFSQVINNQPNESQGAGMVKSPISKEELQNESTLTQ